MSDSPFLATPYEYEVVKTPKGTKPTVVEPEDSNTTGTIAALARFEEVRNSNNYKLIGLDIAEPFNLRARIGRRVSDEDKRRLRAGEIFKNSFRAYSRKNS